MEYTERDHRCLVSTRSPGGDLRTSPAGILGPGILFSECRLKVYKAEFQFTEPEFQFTGLKRVSSHDDPLSKHSGCMSRPAESPSRPNQFLPKSRLKVYIGGSCSRKS